MTTDQLRKAMNLVMKRAKQAVKRIPPNQRTILSAFESLACRRAGKE